MKHLSFFVTHKATKYFFLLGLVLLIIVPAMASSTSTADAKVQPRKKNARLAKTQPKTVDNNNDFACNLLRTITEQNQGSTIVSPISVGFVLGMLNEGAGGETRQQITDVLGLGGSVKEVNEYFKKVMEGAQSADPCVTLKTANCLNIISAYDINSRYRDDMQKYYNAMVDAVDYDAGDIVDKINNWCKAQTDGMIPDLLDAEELNPNRVMYLLNAVYFKASWTEKFDPRETRDVDFTTLDGKIVKRPMMHLETKAAYANHNLFQMLRLPYGNKAYSMYVLLPDEDKTINDIIHNFSAQNLKDWQSQMRTQDVDILMPRFTTESETHLENALSLMGMPRAFGMEAEFPNMVEGHQDDLLVSMMKQKAKIEVSEEGTKAAAVTVAEVAEKGVSRHEIVEFHATRPFVYYIVEERTGTIIFMGTYCFDENGVPATIKDSAKRNFTRRTFGVYDPEKANPEKADSEKADTEKIYTTVEQMPVFPGGDAALVEYLETHVEYPPEVGTVLIQGTVVVQFVVEKDGSVGEVKVVRSLDKDYDNEAIRLCKSLPKFTPGRHHGQAVRVWYTLPVRFKLKAIEDEVNKTPKDKKR